MSAVRAPRGGHGGEQDRPARHDDRRGSCRRRHEPVVGMILQQARRAAGVSIGVTDDFVGTWK
jgi:hypothetical protein